MIPRRFVLQVATGAIVARLLDKLGAWRIADDAAPRPDLEVMIDEPHPRLDPVAFVELIRAEARAHRTLAIYLPGGAVLELQGSGPAGAATAIGLGLELPPTMQTELEALLLRGTGTETPRGLVS